MPVLYNESDFFFVCAFISPPVVNCLFLFQIYYIAVQIIPKSVLAVNIKKNILCGRNFEYFSEDPYLAGELASEYINGVEENGVAACIKHFAANNQKKYRTDISSEADERTLREIYLKPFEIAVKNQIPLRLCAHITN